MRIDVVSAKRAALSLLVACMLSTAVTGCQERRRPQSAKPARKKNVAERSRTNRPVPPQPGRMRHIGVRTDTGAPAPVNYFQLVFNARDLAKRTKALSDLRVIAQGVRMFSASNGRFPKSLDELAASGMVPRDALNSPVKGAGRFEYIAGLKPGSPADSILAYDGKVIYSGKCCAVRLDGAAITLSPDQLESQVRKTLRTLGR